MAALSVVLAVLAAAANAVSSVLQRAANRDEPPTRRMSVSILVDVVRHKDWIIGLLLLIGSFVLQATALGFGQLSVVEPVIAVELPLTLVIASRVFRHPLSRRDWYAILGMTAGLALLLFALAPRSGGAAPPGAAIQLAALSVTVLFAALLWLASRATDGARRTALLGVAAGSTFGLTASLIKGALIELDQGGVHQMLASWQTYTFPVTGLSALVLVQAALHAGTLVAAQPGFTLADPIVSIVWGTVVFGESTRTSGLAIAGAVIGMLVVVAGVLLLARSAALTESGRDRPRPGDR